MNRIDGTSVGTVTGLIGVLIIGILTFMGTGDINAIIGLITIKIARNSIITGYITIELSLIAGFVLGLVGVMG